MINIVITALGLGVAGIDPLGALLLMSAIAAGMSRFKIKLFTITVFVSTILTGLLLSFLGTGLIESIKMSIPNATSSVWVYVDIIIAVAISMWLISKMRRKSNTIVKKKKILKGTSVTIFLAGLLFGVTAIFDPTFLANISFAAQTKNVGAILVIHTIWITISQIMLFGLFVAYLLGKHEKLIMKFKNLWHRHSALFNRVIFGAGVGAVLFLVADSVSYLIRGIYFLQ